MQPSGKLTSLRSEAVNEQEEPKVPPVTEAFSFG